MPKRLSGDQDLSAAYKNGRCRDCNDSIQPLGPSSRCDSCDEKRQEYIDSGWGLNELISRKTTDKDVLGLCFICGDSLVYQEEELVCPHCRWKKNSKNSGYRLNGYGDNNPYKSVWDVKEDNSVCLTPSYGVLAERALSTARHFKRMSERGGPRGRDHQTDADTYFRLAKELKDSEDKARRQR